MTIPIFEFFSWLFHTAMDSFRFLAHTAMERLSDCASLFFWPLRTGMDALHDYLGVPVSWTPAVLLAGAALLLLLLILTGWAILASNRRNK